MTPGRRDGAARRRKGARSWAVFLDRDGTLLHLLPYLGDPARARLYDGVGPALRRLRDAGARLVVVTNQSGVARGFFGRADVERVHRRMAALLRAEGVRLDAIEVCPHAAVAGGCRCRKPAPGMILRAARRLGIDLAESWTIGDNVSDLEAGRAAGTRTGLVLTGYGRRTRKTAAGRRADRVGGRLGALVTRVLAARQRSEGGGSGR